MNVKKALAVAVILLFISVSVIPSTGNISKVSSVCKYNNPPYEPSNPCPPNGSTNWSCPGGICWTGGDPDGDKVYYDMYFGKTSPPPKIMSNITTNCTKPDYLEFNTTYYWKIVAWDEHGASTEGPIWSFTTMANSPPYEPSNPFPEDGATNVPINVTFCWDGGDPTPGDFVLYDVYLGFVCPPHNLVSYHQTETCYEATGLELYERYYWLIVAWDSLNASTEGPCWTFTTGINNPPDRPKMAGPLSGRVGARYVYDIFTEDPDGDNVSYYIEWGDGTSTGWTDYYPSGMPISIKHTWYRKGTYLVRCRAKDVYDFESGWWTIPWPGITISEANYDLCLFEVKGDVSKSSKWLEPIFFIGKWFNKNNRYKLFLSATLVIMGDKNEETLLIQDLIDEDLSDAYYGNIEIKIRLFIGVIEPLEGICKGFFYRATVY
ncbi:MAG: hypothetical protein JSW60_06775 [Thermoplasmatales archaeon]|nr:MAG: hypothetical protein JSW60_06775 [Thermoplasmatales archaeon]